MVRIRLKADYPINKMNTPYGLVTREWQDFKDDVYIYKEMEVEGLIQPESQPEKVEISTPVKVESKEEVKINVKPVVDKKKVFIKKR